MKQSRLAGMAALALLVACEHTLSPQLTEAAATEPSQESGGPKLPAHWSGTGILAKRDDVPNEAPVWAGIKAEVVDRGGQRYLRATGKAADVDNPALGRSTAENRGRAELAHWLSTHALSGAQVVDTYSAGPQLYMVLVEIAVPQQILGPTQ